MLRSAADPPGRSIVAAAAPGAQADARIRRVSDTAFWTAGIRAKEQQHPDPAFVDPYAAMLAGEKGQRIARRLAHAAEIDWGVNMRTVSIDRLVMQALSCGVDSVLSLGAGLDARPYRLQMPKRVVWVEADLPEIVEYKNAKLANQVPRCSLERVAGDLGVARDRRRILSRIVGSFRNTLVIAEGVLPYLSSQEVGALASELHEETHATRWIVDFDAGGLDWARNCRQELRAAPRRFQLPHMLAFLHFSGWQTELQIGTGQEAALLGRPYPLRFPRGLLWQVLPAHWKAQIQNSSGVAMLRRS